MIRIMRDTEVITQHGFFLSLKTKKKTLKLFLSARLNIPTLKAGVP